MSDTLGSLRAEIILWLRGDLLSIDDQTLINVAINDAIEDGWMAMMKAALSRFFGLDSPVTFSLPAGAERVQLVSIADPTVAPATGSYAGGAQLARTLLVGYTYVTESGSETQLSPTAQQVVGPNNLGQVTAPAAVAGAFGWNCYVSPSNTAGLMALQNQQPLPFNANYQEPPAGWQDYSAAQQLPPQAQVASIATPALSPPPSENTTGDNISYITHLEVRTSDTLLRTWNQADIDSEIMRRFGRTLSTASEFQSYAWDLINGNRLEIRPATGMAFNPRYFYIAKPRRLRYPATIPYQNITGVHEFFVNKAISRLKLSLDEYIAAEAWEKKAETGKLAIVTALAQESWSKNMRIAPHLW
jgi:hypothetical protein